MATLADTDASRLGGTWSTTATYGSVAEFNLDIR